MDRVGEKRDEADIILIQRIAIVHQYFLQVLMIAQEIAEAFLAEMEAAAAVEMAVVVAINREMRPKRRIFDCFEI